LKLAREVADDTGSLMAGDISHSWVYKEDGYNKEVKEMFKVMNIQQIVSSVMSIRHSLIWRLNCFQ